MAKTVAIFFYAAVSLAALVCADKELPKELRDPSMFCEGCFGTISEVSALMEEAAGNGSKLSDRIEKVLGTVCHTDNLRKYVFSPPKMVKVCSAIVKTFRTDLTSLLREEFRAGKVAENAPLVEKFCRGATGACADREIPSEARQKKEL